MPSYSTFHSQLSSSGVCFNQTLSKKIYSFSDEWVLWCCICSSLCFPIYSLMRPPSLFLLTRRSPRFVAKFLPTLNCMQVDAFTEKIRIRYLLSKKIDGLENSSLGTFSKKIEKCGNFQKKGGGRVWSTLIHFFCNLTKWLFASFWGAKICFTTGGIVFWSIWSF